MAHVEYSTSSYKTPLHHRITASMPVRASWVDSETGETVSVEPLPAAGPPQESVYHCHEAPVVRKPCELNCVLDPVQMEVNAALAAVGASGGTQERY